MLLEIRENLVENTGLKYETLANKKVQMSDLMQMGGLGEEGGEEGGDVPAWAMKVMSLARWCSIQKPFIQWICTDAELQNSACGDCICTLDYPFCITNLKIDREQIEQVPVIDYDE